MAASDLSDIPDNKPVGKFCVCNNCKISRGEGTQLERERILKILQDRHEDLLSCTKKDNCQDLAEIVAVCIEDIKYKDEK
jgi:hypothetical protein